MIPWKLRRSHCSFVGGVPARDGARAAPPGGPGSELPRCCPPRCRRDRPGGTGSAGASADPLYGCAWTSSTSIRYTQAHEKGKSGTTHPPSRRTAVRIPADLLLQPRRARRGGIPVGKRAGDSLHRRSPSVCPPWAPPSTKAMPRPTSPEPAPWWSVPRSTNRTPKSRKPAACKSR